MEGGRKSEITLQRTQQSFSLQEISYEKEFTQAKFCLGRIVRLCCHFGSIGPFRGSSSSFIVRDNASGSKVHVSGSSGGPNGEGGEVCASQRFNQDRLRRHQFDGQRQGRSRSRQPSRSH